MADWPDREQLKQVFNIEGANAGDWDLTVDLIRESAIATVKDVRGEWDEDVDRPDDKLAVAALRMAELMSDRPGAPVSSLIRDAAFQAHMHGHRRRFGIA